jgi:hypothetical protein
MIGSKRVANDAAFTSGFAYFVQEMRNENERLSSEREALFWCIDLVVVLGPERVGRLP